jgi:hypothetical protein
MLINTYIILIILNKEFQLSENRCNFKTLLCKVKGASPPLHQAGAPLVPPGGNTVLGKFPV